MRSRRPCRRTWLLLAVLGAPSLPVCANDVPSLIPERDPCATYSWESIEQARSYELVVMALGPDEEAAPVLQVELASSATAWTPTLDQCLEPGRRFFWSLRASTDDGPTEWSPPYMFDTSGERREGPPEGPEGETEETVGAESPVPAGSSFPGVPRSLPKDIGDRVEIGGKAREILEPPQTAPPEPGYRQRELPADIARRPTVDEILASARMKPMDFEILEWELRAVDSNLHYGDELELVAQVRVNNAGERRSRFFLALGSPDGRRYEALSEVLLGEGEGPFEVAMRVAMKKPLIKDGRLETTLFLGAAREASRIGSQIIWFREPLEDGNLANHQKRISRPVLQPEYSIVSVERLGGPGSVRFGQHLELEVVAQVSGSGSRRLGVQVVAGDPADGRIDVKGPRAFRRGDGEYSAVRLRVPVTRAGVEDRAFRTTVLLLNDKPSQKLLSDRLLTDRNPLNHRREVVIPVDPAEFEPVVVWNSVDPDCKPGLKMASDLWKDFRRKAKEAGCLSPLKLNTAACFVEGAMLPLKLGDNMVGHWNDLANNNWATLGPRRIEPGPMKGTLETLGKRLFVGTAPVAAEEIEIALAKRGGKARARVTICQTYESGGSRKVRQWDIEPETEEGALFLERIRGSAPSVLTVELDYKGGPGPLRAVKPHFKYTLEVTEKPRKNTLPRVEGFADLHLHQFARLAHAGHWFWGEHDGDRSDALTKCSHLKHAIAPKWLVQSFRHGAPDEESLDNWPRWDDIAHQQVYAQWLRRAHKPNWEGKRLTGLNLAVVPAVNFEPFCYILKTFYPNQNTEWGCRDMDNVRRQIEAAHDFDREHDWYEIALNPWHARQIILEGKLAIVLSVEASHVFPSQDGDVAKQLADLYQMGVRTLQLTHQTDSRFAGAAPHHRGVMSIFQRIKHPLKGGFKAFKFDDNGKNAQGLTGEGRRLIERMMGYKMPIDLAHLSQKASQDVFEMARDNKYYPLFNSHTRFEPVLTPGDLKVQGELLSTCKQIRYIERTGGMVGVRTGENKIRSTADEVPNDCPGSSKSFAQLIEFGNRYSSVAMGFGSDLNGFIEQVGPRFGADACHMEDNDRQRSLAAGKQGAEPASTPWFNLKGLSHVGLLPDLLVDLKRVGVDTQRLENSAEAFLSMWERAYSGSRQEVRGSADCEQWRAF